jgi:hypothetical protein
VRLGWPFGGKARDDGDEAWAKKADDAWVQSVDSWPWRLIGEHEWEKSDQCPWCKHEMKVEQSGAWTEAGPPAVGAGRPEEEAAGPPPPETGVRIYARCNCGEKHPGRPPEITRGCGRWGLIIRPPAQ